MSAEKKPGEIVVFANGRVPAEFSKAAQQLCGRIPADSDIILARAGRVPHATPNALLARPVDATQPMTQIVDNTSQKIPATEKLLIESSAPKVEFPSARKSSQ